MRALQGTDVSSEVVDVSIAQASSHCVHGSADTLAATEIQQVLLNEASIAAFQAWVGRNNANTASAMTANTAFCCKRGFTSRGITSQGLARKNNSRSKDN